MRRWMRGVPLLEWLAAVRARRVRRRLLRDDRVAEVVVDEVHHHWVVHVPAMLEVVVAVLLVVGAAVASMRSAWVLLVLAFAVLCHAAWRWLAHFMDVFVITDLRVLRLSGVLSDNHASTPLTRILDITVEKPFLGRILNYGHFTFESAAQEQGLRDIRFVAHPLERDEQIQSMQMRLLAGKRAEQTP